MKTAIIIDKAMIKNGEHRESLIASFKTSASLNPVYGEFDSVFILSLEEVEGTDKWRFDQFRLDFYNLVIFISLDELGAVTTKVIKHTLGNIGALKFSPYIKGENDEVTVATQVLEQ